MRARWFLVVFLAVLMVPGVAHAKGPDQATIDGEGMVAPISVEGTEGQADDLSTLADVAGLWPAAYPQTPDPMLVDAPTEDLGPKLEITWRLPAGGPTPATVRQELYFYAEGGPLTYTPPDQPLVEGGRTTGGWFRTPTVLQPKWETFDLPTRTTLEGTTRPDTREAPPVRDPGHGLPVWPVIVVLVAATFAAAGVSASRFTSARRVRIGSA